MPSLPFVLTFGRADPISQFLSCRFVVSWPRPLCPLLFRHRPFFYVVQVPPMSEQGILSTPTHRRRPAPDCLAQGRRVHLINLY